MSDVVWQALIAGVVTLILAYMQHRTKESLEKKADDAAQKAKEVAVKADQVRTTLQDVTARQGEKLDEMAKVGSMTHDLVNSASLVQLRLYAVAARRIAELTGERSDLEAADTAERLHREHEQKQQAATAKSDTRRS